MKFYSFTPLTWDEVAMINRAAKKKKKEASSHLYGLEQCSRQKQGKKKKKCLTVLPLECIQYILCVLERRGVCVSVRGMLAGRLSAYKYHITTQGNSGISRSFQLA